MKSKILILLFIVSVITVSGCAKVSVEDVISSKENNEENSITKDYILPSDTSLITEVDLSNLNETELKYAYEEIFARHGKIFNDENYVRYFNSKDWYTPNPSYNERDLTDLEMENRDYISEYINEHFESTTEVTTVAQSVNSNSDNNTVIVVHDEPYYYEHYWGDNTFIIPDSSIRKLSASELSGFSSDTLALIRNEIYARNGYIFQKEKYKNYFGSKLWYTPNPNFNESWLNETEKYNIQLIKSME